MKAGPVPLLVLLALSTAGCASVPAMDAAVREPAPPPLIRFGVDTFAFPNESRTKNRGKPDLYANYCFVMARAVTQFHRFARFEPAAPKLSSAAYEKRVARVVSHAPWEEPAPPDDRVVIPGYPSLYDLSRHEEDAVKAGLGSPFWTWVHWTNWRVVFPMPGAQQERVARETMAELQAGRVVQWLVTNFPTWELNHTVLAYEYRIGDNGAVLFAVYDPNDPNSPGLVVFDRAERRFVADRLFDTNRGTIRAFRMYYGPVL
jgi:hypothetical protein